MVLLDDLLRGVFLVGNHNEEIGSNLRACRLPTNLPAGPLKVHCDQIIARCLY